MQVTVHIPTPIKGTIMTAFYKWDGVGANKWILGAGGRTIMPWSGSEWVSDFGTTHGYCLCCRSTGKSIINHQEHWSSWWWLNDWKWIPSTLFLSCTYGWVKNSSESFRWEDLLPDWHGILLRQVRSWHVKQGIYSKKAFIELDQETAFCMPVHVFTVVLNKHT